METTEFSDPLFVNLLILSVIMLPVKAYGLWKSAKNNQKGWFIVMLLINTAGILELAYLFYFSKQAKQSK